MNTNHAPPAGTRNRVFHELLDHLPDPVLLIDPRDGRIVDVNWACCNELGYARQEMLALRIYDIDTAINEELFLSAVNQLRETPSLVWEGLHQRKDSSCFPTEVKLRYVRLQQDYVLAAARNITERRRLEQSLREETHRRQILVDESRDGIVVMEQSGKVVEANRAFAEMLGYSQDELLQMCLWDWEHNYSREKVEEMLRTIDEAGDHFETRHTRKDGTVIDVELSTNATIINNRKLVFAVSRDITERKRSENSLKLAAMVYQNSREAMMVTDGNGHLVAINPTFTRVTGYAIEEVLGTKPPMLHGGEQPPEFYVALWTHLHRNGHWNGETVGRRKDGTLYPVWLSINAVYDGKGEAQSWVAQFSDITDKKDAEQLIWRQANFDHLTGLPNRRMFLDRLGEEIKKSKRSGLPMALLFLDLDHFKLVNDSLGHDMGDLLLQQAAGRLRECVRESDTISRLGGDEFTLILTNLSDSDRVGAIAQKILWKLTEPFTLGNEQAFVSASIGITLYPADAGDAEGLLKNADQAMYGSKKAGRGRYQYFTPAMQDAALKRIRLSNDLREALAQRQLSVVYQPLYALQSGRIEKAEALVRWQHPDEGMISPARFLPVAEECGLISSIGDLVFEDVVRNCKDWRAVEPDIQICVNKSPAQFNSSGRDGQTEPWIQMLKEQQVAGTSIVVEVPESLLLDARPEIIRQLLALRDAGVGVALDDFGTGYSSLSCLRKFDIDFLKIDPSFIQQLTPGGEEQILCTAVITMAHNLGLRVVAEGVETAAQAALLKELGCDHAQGYYFSPAVSAADLKKLLQKQCDKKQSDKKQND
jgi:diguanylate cyclase (GGDEF)-like protein/PAS domain S-box-containing protein